MRGRGVGPGGIVQPPAGVSLVTFHQAPTRGGPIPILYSSGREREGSIITGDDQPCLVRVLSSPQSERVGT